MTTSIVHSSIKIDDSSHYGDFCVIGNNVKIGRGCAIGHHVVIHEDVEIGDNVRIDDFSVLGKLPMKAASSAVTHIKELAPCRIESDCIIGSSVVIYRGCTIGRKVLVADLATIREDVTVGEYTIVGRGVAIENKCTIGRRVKLETNCYITAMSTLEDRVFVAPCVATSNDNYLGRTEKRFEKFGGVIIRKGGRVGLNATILPGKTIGRDAVVAAGALVTKDVPDKQIVSGIPARFFREVPAEEQLENQGWDDIKEK
ncbi:MAG: DapH/DapD/GlmU-related protein [bacterium]|nr:DapH/DapD/GlmU-related protein [bacterium]